MRRFTNYAVGVGVAASLAYAAWPLPRADGYAEFTPDGAGYHAEPVNTPSGNPILEIRQRGKNIIWETYEVQLENGNTVTLTVHPMGPITMQEGETLEDMRRKVWDGYQGKTYEEWWGKD